MTSSSLSRRDAGGLPASHGGGPAFYSPADLAVWADRLARSVGEFAAWMPHGTVSDSIYKLGVIAGRCRLAQHNLERAAADCREIQAVIELAEAELRQAREANR